MAIPGAPPTSPQGSGIGTPGLTAAPALRSQTPLFTAAIVCAVALSCAWPTWPSGTIQWLVSWGAGVVVPLGLALATDPDRAGTHPRTFLLARWLVPAGAMTAVASGWCATGTTAAALAGITALGLIALAAHGVRRLLRRGALPIEELAVDAGLLLAAGAGPWLVASRAGVGLLGFSEPTVLLTAAHFLFCGFGASVVLGAGARLLPARERAGWALRVAVLAVCGGIPVTAAGILLGRGVDSAAALVVASGMLWSAALIAFRIAPTLRRSARLRGGGVLGAWVLRIAPGLLVLSMGAAALFAVTGSVARGAAWSELLSLPRMVALHGWVNAIGFVTPCLVVLAIANPLPHVHPGVVVTSALRGGAFIGADFFHRIGALHPEKAVTGLVGSMSSYRAGDFDPALVHPAVRRFYEHTARFDMEVTPRWSALFVPGAWAWRQVAKVIGQLELPTGAVTNTPVRSEIVGLDDAIDGRSDVRRWIRTDLSTGRPIYVAAYSCVTAFGQPLMNIAFPLPLGSLTSVLRFEPGPREGGLRLVTWSAGGEKRGDEGIYFANALLPVRLPMQERIEVFWDEGAAGLRATHDLWLFGVRSLQLEYAMRERAG